MLAVDTSDLDVIFVRNFLELRHLYSKFGKGNMHRRSECSSKVAWARGDVTKMIVVRKLSNLFNLSDSLGESSKDGIYVSSLLH